MSILFIFIPLLTINRAVLRNEHLSFNAFVLYFFALGAGFMLLEIPLLQDFILLLGHPSASLSVVLFAILAGGSVGSFWTQRWPAASRDRRLLVSGLIAAIWVLLLTLVIRGQLQSLAGWPLSLRCIMVGCLTLPVGFCLGTFFPTGLAVVVAIDPRLIPWAIGLNGIASVLGSILAVACGIFFGFWQACLFGIAVYVIAWLAFCRLKTSAELKAKRVLAS